MPRGRGLAAPKSVCLLSQERLPAQYIIPLATANIVTVILDRIILSGYKERGNPSLHELPLYCLPGIESTGVILYQRMSSLLKSSGISSP